MNESNASRLTLVEDSIDFDRYMRETEESRHVREASSYRQSLQSTFHGQVVETGLLLPWGNTESSIRLRPGELSIWAGINGHGKSLATGLVALFVASQGAKVCIASFEMKPIRTLGRMVRQASGGALPAPAFIDRFCEWGRDRIWMYDHQGTVRPEVVLAVARYCHKELAVTHFFIDSLMKCVRGEDDYNGQKDFVDALATLARDTGMHVHLVHHIRKRDDEKQIPGKFDLKGSGSIADQADNVFIWWRNKGKEERRRNGDEIDESLPDAALICEKQRNGEHEGKFLLWFEPKSMQYLGGRRAEIRSFLP